ncbi:MAG: hypothetical protein PHP39_06390, partial [Oscillospiraceae bacterium]|nr:hypothetical protein [Oscillospiraceae bacterium]
NRPFKHLHKVKYRLHFDPSIFTFSFDQNYSLFPFFTVLDKEPHKITAPGWFATVTCNVKPTSWRQLPQQQNCLWTNRTFVLL